MTTILSRRFGGRIFKQALIGLTLISFIAPSFAFAATEPTGSFDADRLSETSAKPKLAGDAEDVKNVRVVVEDAKGKRLYRSPSIKVRDDRWKVSVNKKLKDGIYAISLVDSKHTSDVLATSTLGVGVKASFSAAYKSGSVNVTQLPLLTGGHANAGLSVPVAYLKVSNPGTVDAAIDGFTFVQNGTASTDAVIGFMTSDDKGGSRATVGGAEDTKVFADGKAFVPLEAVLAPGQVRVFTIKAILGAKAGAEIGRTLMLDVAGVNSAGTARASAWPIRGTTWAF